MLAWKVQPPESSKVSLKPMKVYLICLRAAVWRLMRLRLARAARMRKAQRMQKAKWIGKVDARRAWAGEAKKYASYGNY